MKETAGGYTDAAAPIQALKKIKDKLKTIRPNLGHTLNRIGERIKAGKPTGRLRGELDAQSVDPGGWGVSHNTNTNARKNRQKSTKQITDQINERAKAGKPTYQLRRELGRRSVDSNEQNFMDYS